MSKPFVYGMSVEGENFTDREVETKRLVLNNPHFSSANGENVAGEKSKRYG